MLGHAVWLNLKDDHDTFGSIRGSLEELSGRCSLFSKNDKKIISNTNVLSDSDLGRALDTAEPDVIVNCVRIIKQLLNAKLVNIVSHFCFIAYIGIA